MASIGASPAEHGPCTRSQCGKDRDPLHCELVSPSSSHHDLPATARLRPIDRECGGAARPTAIPSGRPVAPRSPRGRRRSAARPTMYPPSRSRLPTLFLHQRRVIEHHHQAPTLYFEKLGWSYHAKSRPPWQSQSVFIPGGQVAVNPRFHRGSPISLNGQYDSAPHRSLLDGDGTNSNWSKREPLPSQRAPLSTCSGWTTLRCMRVGM